jgi:succinate dehydrogenase / fumarate reductase iron-sulfur subunit
MSKTNGSTKPKMIEVRVKRQDSPDSEPYWETFEVEDEGNMNVISCLMAIQRNPVTKDGKKTTAPVWEQACLEEVCGSCTMVVNGKVRQSCTALTDKYQQPITLEPMRKFPVMRDLMVDRQRMFESLKKVKAWNPIDGTYDLGPGPRISQEQQSEMYVMSTCMTCGCCLDACPQVFGEDEENDFIGAAAISQARLFNMNPTGKNLAKDRIEALMDEGGLHACGNAQNCVEVCPKEIPLTTSIADMARQTTTHALKSLFLK